MKITLGFILGVVSTLGVLRFIGKIQNTEEYQLGTEIRTQTLKNLKKYLNEMNVNEDDYRNIQSFELTTPKGIVKLHTSMSKDSVKIIMGRPQSTDIHDNGIGSIKETWKYKGSNRLFEEFTLEFVNGKLKSVSQIKDH